MNTGNYQYKAGERVDTGDKFIDKNLKSHTIYRKMLDTGNLGNSAATTILHGEAIDLSRYSKVVGLYADNNVQTVHNGQVQVNINATQVVMTTTTNLSTYHGKVIIEFCLSDGSAES